MIIYINSQKKIKGVIGIQNLNILRSVADNVKDLKERIKEVDIDRKKLSNKIQELMSFLTIKEVDLAKELLKTGVGGINIFKQKEVSLSKVKKILDLRMLLMLQDSKVNSVRVLVWYFQKGIKSPFVIELNHNLLCWLFLIFQNNP